MARASVITNARAFDAIYAGGKDACVIGNLVAGGARRRFQRRLRDTFMLWISALATAGE